MQTVPPALLLAVLAAASLQASPPVALSTVGNVWTNQVALPSGSRVGPGDVIETDESGLAVLASPELGRIEVRASSHVALERHAIALRRGAVASQRLPIRFKGFEVAPRAAGLAWFVVSDRDGQAIVSAHQGDIVIRRPGEAEVIVPARHYAMALPPEPDPAAPGAAAPDPAAPEPAAPDPAAPDPIPADPAPEPPVAPTRRTDPSGSGGARSAGSSTGGFRIGPLGPTTSMAVVGGATAAGLAGFAAAAQSETEAISPE